MLGTGQAMWGAAESDPARKERRIKEEIADWSYHPPAPPKVFGRRQPHRGAGFVNRRTGQFVPGVLMPSDVDPRVSQYYHPNFRGQRTLRSPYIGVSKARRKRYGKALLSFVKGPGVLGTLVGYGGPAVLPASVTAVLGPAIAVGGYLAPAGSWFRKFSIGAGVGTGARGALWAYKKLTAFERWWDTNITQPIKKISDKVDPGGHGLIQWIFPDVYEDVPGSGPNRVMRSKRKRDQKRNLKRRR